MQNNYYFLRQLAKEIAGRLSLPYTEGNHPSVKSENKETYQLLECFSQSKDELVLGFGSPENDFYIKAVLNSDFACLCFPNDFQRAKKNSIDLFKELIGLKILGITQYLNERSFSIEFEHQFQLLFKMHGRRSNIILFKEGDFDIAFHKKMENDKQIIPNALHRPIEQNLEAFKTSEGNLSAIYPTFGKEINEYIENKTFDLVGLEEKWTSIANTVKMLEKPPAFYLTASYLVPELSLLPPENQTQILFQSKSPIEISNEFYFRYTKVSVLDKERNVVVRELHKQRKQAEAYISKNMTKLSDFESSVRNEETANIIMANLHLIPAKAEKIELFDFYQNTTRVIKLKKDLSPQKNAESYYKKSKNEKIEIEKIEQNIEYKRKELQKLDKLINDIEQFTEIKPLRVYFKNHKLVKENKKETIAKDQLFKKFEYQGFDILVGKNAKNNDLLIQHSYKEDLWLHAKDVTGSHVVIKHQSGKIFPKEVIEKAASLAAYYSKRSKDSLCPVIVTPRKYVRKTKDLMDGQVIVEKEEVILVIPESF